MFLLYLRWPCVPVSPRNHGDATVDGVPVSDVLPDLVQRVHDAKLDAEICSHVFCRFDVFRTCFTFERFGFLNDYPLSLQFNVLMILVFQAFQRFCYP